MAEDGKINQVIGELKQKQQEYPHHKGLKRCVQYIENRPGQFNYKRSKWKELPLGSGKVESTHRSMMQKRLKKPGTWWLRENAARIAKLRTLRTNGGWEYLWQGQSKLTPLRRAA